MAKSLKCPGVGRDKDCVNALEFYFSRPVTDDEMRFLHDVMQRAVACTEARREAVANAAHPIEIHPTSEPRTDAYRRAIDIVRPFFPDWPDNAALTVAIACALTPPADLMRRAHDFIAKTIDPEADTTWTEDQLAVLLVGFVGSLQHREGRDG